MRALVLAAAFLAVSTCVPGQTFEVASVKHKIVSDIPSPRLNCSDGGRFLSVDFPVQVIVQWAYGIQFFQLAGATPGWIADYRDAYNVDARSAGPVTQAQCRLMVQALLADRFKLKVHRETKELPSYALRLGKNKPKLQEAGEKDVVKVQGHPYFDESQAQQNGWTMHKLASYLSGAPSLDGRAVVDQTGLTGTYKIDFVYAFMPNDNDRPDVFAAVQDQLGLKLEATKAPVEMLVIDGIERPSEN
ncbi:MAG TPA: TIGR03435 family protein [Bryobacteraceae bacterium]|jgi:uncharacterized protein (TIGR03435 family)